MQYKIDQEARLFVRLRDSVTGLPVTGVLYSGVTLTIQKGDGTTQTVSVTSPMWSETTTGAFSGKGVYNLLLPLGNVDVAGPLAYQVNSSSAEYTGLVEVVESTPTDVASLMTDLRKYEGNRTKVVGGQLIIYDDDGTTPWKTFNLKDEDGNSTNVAPFERTPV